MKMRLYPRLAWQGIRKNGKIYFPYLAACIFVVMVFYLIGFLSSDPVIREMEGGAQMQVVLSLGDSGHGRFFRDLSFLYEFLSYEKKEEGAGALSHSWNGSEKYCFCADLGKSYDGGNFSGNRTSGRHSLFQTGAAGYDLSAEWESRFFFFY